MQEGYRHFKIIT